MSARKLIGGGFLLIAWLLTAAALLVHPIEAAHKGTDRLAMATDHRAQLTAFAALYLPSRRLFIPALVESGPIDVLRGPISQMPDAMQLRDFAPTATERVSANSDQVVFGRK